MKQPLILATALVAAIAAPLSAQTKRAFSFDDIAKVRGVSDPQRSPDGKWVAYTVTTADVEKDKHDTDVWMASWDGKEKVRSRPPRTARSSRAGARTAGTCRFSPRAATRREEEGRSGLAARSARRRGAAAHRDQGRRRRLRVVARRQAPRARRERPRSGRRPGDDGRLEAQDRAADRPRSLPLQAGPSRLPRQARSTSTCSTSTARRPSR